VGFILLIMSPTVHCQAVTPTSDQPVNLETQSVINSLPDSTSKPITIHSVTTRIANTTQSMGTCSMSEVCGKVTSYFNSSLNAVGDQCSLDMYAAEFQEIIDKSDCRNNSKPGPQLLRYSNITECTRCLEAYNQWLCSTVSNYTGYTVNTTIRSCDPIICQRARRLCPYLHHDGSDYSSDPGFICNDFDEEDDANFPCYFFKDSSSDEDELELGEDLQSTCEDAISEAQLQICVLDVNSAAIAVAGITNISMMVMLTSLVTLLTKGLPDTT